ncbi:hypothetical protein LDENG_00019370 [Lucifuga dentata]|nr:hypothetical protein LDENG_00019370 [Lucifuga dentata]
MEGTSTTGVLSQLSLLEVQARSRKVESQQQSRVKELKAEIEALTVQRDQLKAERETHKVLQKLRRSMDKNCTNEEEEIDEDSDNSQLLHVMARHTQLKDLLNAHHLIGGYNVIETHQGKAMCVSLTTAYNGVYLETYNLEIGQKPPLRIIRHNIPPFIPVNSLAEESNLKTDVRVFLDTLSQHLNAYAGRKQQLKLVKELHKSVEVMESNVLYSILVLLFTVPREQTAILCTLNYTNHTRTLPTQVSIECREKDLSDCPQWKKNCSLLQDTPVHTALTTMKTMGDIA